MRGLGKIGKIKVNIFFATNPPSLKLWRTGDRKTLRKLATEVTECTEIFSNFLNTDPPLLRRTSFGNLKIRICFGYLFSQAQV